MVKNVTYLLKKLLISIKLARYNKLKTDILSSLYKVNYGQFTN
jgi:hypothetical protein